MAQMANSTATSDTDNSDVSLLSVILYTLVLSLLIVFFIWHMHLRFHTATTQADENGDKAAHFGCGSALATLLKVRVGYYLVGLAFAGTRLAWSVVALASGSNGTIAGFILNRIALALFFSVFSLVLVHALHRYYGGGSPKAARVLKRWQIGVGVLNGVVYIFLCVLLVALAVTGDNKVAREGHPLYEVNILSVAFLSLLLGAVFLYYGWQLWQLVSHSGDPDPKAVRRLALIAAMTAALFVCFILRVVMFLWRPITGSFLPNGVWFSFAYWVPEILPISLQTAYVHMSSYEKNKQQIEIDELYKMHEGSIESSDDRPAAGINNSDGSRSSGMDPIQL